MPSPDITTGLQLAYSCIDAADNQVDSSGLLHVPLPVTASGLFPSRFTESARVSRLFSRAGTSGATSVPDNYAKASGVLQATYQAIASTSKTVAFWHKRVPDGGGYGTNFDSPFTLAGDGSGSSSTKGATAMSIRLYRSTGTGSPNHPAVFWSKLSGSNTSVFTTYTIPDNVWVHYTFVMTKDGLGNCTVALYINGVFQEITASILEPSQHTIAPDAGLIGIGFNLTGTTSGQIGGYLSAVNGFSRALSAIDVQALASAVPAPDAATGLQCRYRCNDAADGTVTDSGPHGFDLTVTAAGGFPARVSTAGKLARLFNRPDDTAVDYALRGITSAQYQAMFGANNGHNGEHTVAMWMRRKDASDGGFFEAAFSIHGIGLLDPDLQGVTVGHGITTADFYPLPGELAYFADDPTFVSFEWLTGHILPLNQWQHVAFVIRNTVVGVSYLIDLYVDGVLVATSPSQPASIPMTGVYPSVSAEIDLGAVGYQSTPPTAAQFGGSVANVCAYSRALTAADVAALFATGVAAPNPDPTVAPVVTANKTSSGPVTAANKKTTFSVG